MSLSQGRFFIVYMQTGKTDQLVNPCSLIKIFPWYKVVWSTIKKKEFAPTGANSFPLRGDPQSDRAEENEKDKVTSIKCVALHLRIVYNFSGPADSEECERVCSGKIVTKGYFLLSCQII